MGNASQTAAALEAIREDIRELKLRLQQPTQREHLRERARVDKEHPDPMPHSLYESGANAPETIQQQIQRYVRQEVSAHAALDELETFDQADDFEEDNFDALPASMFEVQQELEDDPEMPRILDADDSRAIPQGDSSPAEPPLQPQQPAASSVPEGDASSSNEGNTPTA